MPISAEKIDGEDGMKKAKVIVAMWPYRMNFDLNPYTALLAGHLVIMMSK